ncbi:MAG: hypothetical protein ACOYOJ_00955, partial [Alsobacter sp.]
RRKNSIKAFVERFRRAHGISEQLRVRPFMSVFSAIFLCNKRPAETIWPVSLFLRQLPLIPFNYF